MCENSEGSSSSMSSSQWHQEAEDEAVNTWGISREEAQDYEKNVLETRRRQGSSPASGLHEYLYDLDYLDEEHWG